MAQTGYFIIADITGYTLFLTQSELDHAQDILKTLFDVLLKNIKPPLIVSNFQGDAILSYTPTSAISDGSILLDMVDRIYGAFADTLEGMILNTTCTCNACANIPRLDLKFFLHHGQYLLQQMQDRQELSGPDVILAHRLMKNKVGEETGIKAYALITHQAILAMGLEQAATEMIPYQETYDHLGIVRCYVHNLKEVWKRQQASRRIQVSEAEAILSLKIDIPLPPSAAWEFLTRPEIKAMYQGSKQVTITSRERGRTGLGTAYHCVHSDTNVVDQFVLDWRPYSYFTMRENVRDGPVTLEIKSTYKLIETEAGIRFEYRITEPKTSGLITRLIAKIMWHLRAKSTLERLFGPELEKKLRQQIEVERADGRIVVEE